MDSFFTNLLKIFKPWSLVILFFLAGLFFLSSAFFLADQFYLYPGLPFFIYMFYSIGGVLLIVSFVLGGQHYYEMRSQKTSEEKRKEAEEKERRKQKEDEKKERQKQKEDEKKERQKQKEDEEKERQKQKEAEEKERQRKKEIEEKIKQDKEKNITNFISTIKSLNNREAEFIKLILKSGSPVHIKIIYEEDGGKDEYTIFLLELKRKKLGAYTIKQKSGVTLRIYHEFTFTIYNKAWEILDDLYINRKELFGE